MFKYVKKLACYILVLSIVMVTNSNLFIAEEFRYGSKDDEFHLYLDLSDDIIYENIQCNGFSNEIVVKFLDHGKCLGYLEELKAQGRVPQNYVPPSSTGGSSSGNSSTTSPSETEKSTEKTYTQEEIDSAWKETKRTEPTCTAEGSIQYKNKITGKKKTEPLPMLEHVFEKTDTTDSTCTTVGYTYFACSGCGLEGKPVEIPLKEHDFEAKEEDAVMPTCTEEGKLPLVCKNCGEISSKPLAINGHDDGVWKVDRPAKAFTEGRKVLICTVCGEELDSETIPQNSPIPLSLALAIGASAASILAAIIVTVAKKKKIK